MGIPILRVRDENGNVYAIPAIQGTAGNGIASIALKSGTHAPGTTDTYEITFTDGTTFDFFVYNGATGPANKLTIGTVTSGIEASATITGEAPNQVLNLVLKQGDKGNPGDNAPTITGITIRQSDYHMIVTLSDGTSYDAGYCRGASGAGTGDMLASDYDSAGEVKTAGGIAAYVSNAISSAITDAIGGAY